jgi:CDP-paratose 2-epimerase
MRLLITGICGFVGSETACGLLQRIEGLEIWGVDNLMRRGSEGNWHRLRKLGCHLVHGDIRQASDLEGLPAVDWVIDAAANPSVLAGMDGQTSSRQLVEHNLLGTVHLLEFCKRVKAGFILLSTSRVYSIRHLAGLPMKVEDEAFRPDLGAVENLPPGISEHGVAENFPTSAPVSLYGSTKLASEALALEYGASFQFPVWINRCGVLAGAGQFGKIDQGIFSYWLHSWHAGLPLRYIGFGGSGHQVRDFLHPSDLLEVVGPQLTVATPPEDPIFNLGGGPPCALSLARLSQWCARRWPEQTKHYPHLFPKENAGGTQEAENRPFDIPWFVMDSRKATRAFAWQPKQSSDEILESIATHAEENPAWLASVA